jgi:hypothetical protein
VRFIRNTFYADAQMVGNESADIVGGDDFFDSRRLITRCQATNDHDKPPIRGNAWHATKQSAPQCGAVPKFGECCNITTVARRNPAAVRRWAYLSKCLSGFRYTFAGWIGYLIAGFIGACILIASLARACGGLQQRKPEPFLPVMFSTAKLILDLLA